MIHSSTERFLEACGARGPVRLHINGNGTGYNEYRTFNRPFILVGRDPSNDLCLDHPAVSDRHAYLQMLGGSLFCVNLGSPAGLIWDNGPAPSGWLQHNRVVKIGPYALRLDEAGATPAQSVQEPPQQVVLEFVNGKPGSTWTMNRVLTLVGKSPDCAVRLKAPGVSEYHCSLVRTSAGLFAIRLDSAEGVCVNGQPLPWALLDKGDELTVGHVRIRIRDFVTIPAAELLPNVFAAPSPLPDDVVMPLLNQFTALQRQMFDQFQQAIYMMVEMFKKMEREQTELIRQEVDRIHGITEELRLLQQEMGHCRPRAATSEPFPRPACRAPEEVRRVTEEDALPVTGEPPSSNEADKEIQNWLYDQIASLQRERETRLQKLINFLSGQSKG